MPAVIDGPADSFCVSLTVKECMTVPASLPTMHVYTPLESVLALEILMQEEFPPVVI